MTLRTSSFNKSIFKNNLKRFSWGSFIYFVMLFLSTSLPVLLKTSAEWLQRFSYPDDNLHLILKGNLFIFPVLTAVIVPTVVATLIFRTVHSGKQATFIHSLPVNRLMLYFTNIISGLVLILVPIILNTAILALISTLGGYDLIFTALDSLKWAGYLIFVNFVMLSFTSFIAILTGNTLAHMIITYIFNFLPIVLVTTISYIFEQTLYGYYGNNQFVSDVMEYTPIVSFVKHGGMGIENIKAFELVLYFIIAIAFYLISYFLYKSRKLETAGDVVSFKSLKPIFKYLMTFLTCLCAYAIVSNISRGNVVTTLIWVALSSIVVYFSCEMLLRKSLKVIDSYKGYLGFAAVITVTVILLVVDAFSYETYIPNTDKVQGVLFKAPYSYENKEDFLLYDRENIENVAKLHERIVSDKKEIKDNYGNTDYRQILYKLNSGRTVSRVYRIDLSLYKNEYENIYKSNEFKEKEFDIFKYDINKATIGNIRNEFAGEYSKIIENKAELNDLYNAIKKDILSLGYGQIKERGIAFVEFSKKYDERTYNYNEMNHINISINANYQNTLSFLKERGYYNIIFPKSDRISALLISNEMVQNDKDLEYDYKYKTEVIDIMDNYMKVTDKNDIDAIMELAYSGKLIRDNFELKKYRTIYIADTRTQIGFINSEDDIPEVLGKYVSK